MAKITIADNDTDTASAVAASLKQSGHAVALQTSSEGLMKSLQKNRPDLIIIGVELDGSDGRELSRLLNTEKLLKDIPVIITSPYFHSEADVRSYFCDELVSVPFEPATLTSAVDGLLNKASARSAVAKHAEVITPNTIV